MKNSTNPKPNYSDKHITSQLVLPLDYSLLLEENDPIYSFNEIMNEVDLTDLEKEYNHLGRHSYDFRMICKLGADCYMNMIFSLRDMENACKKNINLFLLTGGQTPSHKTIGEFITYRLGDNIQTLFHRVFNKIKEKENIDTTIAFIDGTKIQANANKYTFVWKKATIKYLDRLQDKISDAIKELNLFIMLKYHKEFEVKEEYTPDDILCILDWLKKTADEEDIVFVESSNRNKHPIQRLYMKFEGFAVKMKEYMIKIETCKDRNSYSKTDKDATFMHLKEDYYGGTNLFHAAYNIQLMVSDEYISHVGVYQTPGDTRTFIPLMEDYKKAYGELPLNPVADAGYGSYDNYMYCIQNQLNLTMKFSTYSIEKSRKYTKNIFNKDNWYRDEVTGDYICPNFQRFKWKKDVEKKKGDYLRIDQIHSCGDKCLFCPLHAECTKSTGSRMIKVNPVLEEMKEAVRQNLGTEEGKELKKRRSIEVEGAFGIIKSNWEYDRIHRRGKSRVENEMFWICLGFNLRKYHNKKTSEKLLS